MKTSIRKNSFWLLAARVTTQILSILFTAIIARRLGVDDFGRFAFIASVVFIGNTFTNFGSDTYLIREIAQADRVTKTGAQSLALQLALSAMFCAAVLVFWDTPLLVYSLALFPLSIVSVNNALLRALDRMDLFLGLSLLNGVLQVLAALLSPDVLTLCFLFLLGQILLSVFSYWACRASLPDFRLFPLADFRPIFRQILPFALLAVILVLIQRLGVLFTSAILGDAATGLFSSVIRVVEGLKLGHYAILGALLPVISRGASRSRRSFRKAFVFLMAASSLFALALLVFPRLVILVLYGSEFLDAAGFLTLLGWSLLPYTVSSFISYDLIARGLENVVAASAFFSLLIYLALYSLLVPENGLTGAVWSALIGEFLQGIVFFAFYVVALRRAEVRNSLES
jgi:O-antigen/teichoic acid export membrane protein